MWVLCERASRDMFSCLTAFECNAQVEFAHQALQFSALKPAFKRQAVSLAAGLTCFGLEDSALDRGVGCTHALWHCLAGYAVSSVNALIQYHESQRQDNNMY